MADDEPTYTVVTGKLPQLLKKMRETGIPPKANTPWLKSIGFNGGNDTTMLRVLRYIGFVDSGGVPTPAWNEYRGKNYKEVLGRAIRSGYEDLYAVYPDAHDQPSADLAHVFSTSTKSGKAVVDKMVATFKALVAEAEFPSDGSVAPASSDQETGAATNGASQVASAPSPTVLARTPTAANGLTVNINVQLTLPEGADEQTFEAFFKAMKTHLFPDPE